MANHRDFDDDERDSNVVQVVNTSSEIMRFEIDGVRFKLKHGERAQIHKTHATARAMQPGRDPVPSTIELLTNKWVVPITDPRASSFLTQDERAEIQARRNRRRQAQIAVEADDFDQLGENEV